ncbi:MAG: hypothetical protein RR739_05840, partial [Clostridia bacterium]
LQILYLLQQPQRLWPFPRKNQTAQQALNESGSGLRGGLLGFGAFRRAGAVKSRGCRQKARVVIKWVRYP